MKDELPLQTKIYLRAAELIGQGHCKNGMWRRDGVRCSMDEANQFCYHGALKKASRELGDNGFPYSGPANDRSWPMAYWNDHPDTTADMVAAKLREQAFA